MTALLVLGLAAFNILATLIVYALVREWGMRRAIKAGRKGSRK